MRHFDLVTFTAVRGTQVVAEDVVVVDPDRGARLASQHMLDLAQSCLADFGERPGDRVLRGRRLCSVRRGYPTDSSSRAPR